MTGLVGWWPLNEDSGSTAYDLSGNGNHGSLNGGVVQGVAGKGGLTSYSFDGSDDYVGISDDAIFDFGDGEFTVSLWVRKQNNQRPIAKRGGASSYFDCTFLSDGTTRFLIDDGSTQSDARGSVLENGKWYHIVGVVSNDEVSLYIDGALDASVTNNTGNINNNQPITIGYRGDSYYLDGEVCDVRIYDRALSSEEVQTLYEWGNGDYARPLNDQNSSSAVSRWNFDGDATDSWSGNDGSVNGASFVSDGGVRGGAYSFDGNDYINIGQPSNLDFSATDSFTVAAWFNANSLSNETILSTWPSSPSYILLRVRNGDEYNFGVRGDGSASVNVYPTLDNLETGSWNFMCGTWDGSAKKGTGYFNGSIIGEDTNTSVNGDLVQDNWNIGRRSNGNAYYNGLIDDVRIYDKALSPSEVFELYRWGTRGRDMRKLTVNSR